MRPSKSRHDERCVKCKKTIEIMLGKIYGSVRANYKFDIGTRPEDFVGFPLYETLKGIFARFQSYRGYRDLVRSKTLRRCDFFVVDTGFIVEFDESQHFTIPRKLSLECYPDNLELGFDKRKWMYLCDEIKAKDNDPYFRDEQRAWYDTLRDFLPEIKGLKPTIRIFSKDFQWCNLDPENPVDVEKFNSILGGRKQK